MVLTVSRLPAEAEHPLLVDFDDAFFESDLFDSLPGSDNIDLASLDDDERKAIEALIDDTPIEAVSGVVEDRPYQNRVTDGSIHHFQSGHRGVLIEAATGAGKTVMAFKIISAMIQLKLIETFAWTCARVGLLVQAKAECAAKFPHLLERGTFFSPYSPPPPIKPELLVDDEAQHTASATCMTIGELLQPKYRLGMTATPFRSDKLKLLYSKTVRDAGIKQLMIDGYLAKYDLYQFGKPWTPANVAAYYLADAERWGRSIAFFMSKDECHEFKKLVEAGGRRCAVVLGGQPRVTEQTLSDWRKDKYDILVNVIVLTEGFDDSRLKTVFVRPGSKGPTMQMCGRAFRRFGDKIAQVVQPTLTRYPIMKMVKPHEIYMLNEKDEWQAQSYNERLMGTMSNAMNARMANVAAVKMPTAILKRLNPKRTFRDLTRQPAAAAPAPAVEPGTGIVHAELSDEAGSAIPGAHQFIAHRTARIGADFLHGDRPRFERDPEEADLLDTGAFARRIDRDAAGIDSRSDDPDTAA